MKFPTYEEMGQEVANRALDEFEYKGKTLRQWIEIIYNAELSTNLAEVGTEAISKQQAIDALKGCYCGGEDSCGEPWIYEDHAIKAIKQLPPIQPEIVRCKDCKHWKDSDGVFRRGIGVESKCPLNLHQVYEGTFYCGLGERKEVTT